MGSLGNTSSDQSQAQRARCPQPDGHDRPAGASPKPPQDDRLVYLGADPDGVLLEVMAVETDQALVIIHAMRIRDRYRKHLETPGDEDDG